MMIKEAVDLIIAEQNQSKDKILKAIEKVFADYNELRRSKDIYIGKLEQQIEQLKKDVIENESDCANCGLRQENIKLEKRIEELEAQVKYWKSEYDKLFNED